jgi:histidine decarboxylase
MRGISEFAGRVTRLIYSEKHAAFVAETEQHPFLAHRTRGDPEERPDGPKADKELSNATQGRAQMIIEPFVHGRPRLTTQAGHWQVLEGIERRLGTAHRNHLGYPYNLVGRSAVPSQFAGYLVNNLGDPYVGSHYASEVCDLEREAVDWMMDLWHCDERDAFWGSVGASGTEGNLWALYLGREALPSATLIYSREAHYSIPKAARILGMTAEPVDCEPGGAIDIGALKDKLAGTRCRSVVVALTCGTTVKGAHDDIGAVIDALDEAGFGQENRFVHVDGALNAMVLPFVEEAPSSLQPSFRQPIDSISTSGHKMIGTPMPCGVLVTRRMHVARVASAVAYLRSNDTTLMGSRNGHAVLALWSRLVEHGVDGFRADTRASLQRAEALAGALRAAGVPVLRNPHSLTLLFPQPDEKVVHKYQLACSLGEAHAVIMPSVSELLIDRFLSDYLEWWRSASQNGDGRAHAALIAVAAL